MQYPEIHHAMSYTKNDNVLDIGCGPGWMSIEASRAGVKSVLGIDHFGSSHFEYLEKIYPNLTFQVMDLNELSNLNQNYSKILMSSVLQLVENDQKLLKDCINLLKSNGILVCTVPIGYPLIEFMYGNSFFRSVLVTLFKLAPDYQTFKNNCSKKFNIIGKEYYSQDEVCDLLINSGFRILSVAPTPQTLGSVMFQILLLFRTITRSNKLTSPFDMILFPIGYFDRFIKSKYLAIEIMIVAQKP